jgi:hypothetical protein
VVLSGIRTAPLDGPTVRQLAAGRGTARKEMLVFLTASVVLFVQMGTAPMVMTPEMMTALWLAAGAIVLWRWLPALLNALGLTVWRVSVDDDAAALEPAGTDAAYDDLFAQLRDLGFVPVGRRSKTCWFFLHHWRHTFRAHVFAAAQGDCLAVTYKLRPWDPWRLYFVTAFSDGGIVETANQMERLRIDEPDHVRTGLATPDRGELLDRHREVCRTFAAASSRRVAGLPVADVNRLELHHSARHHRQRHRWTGVKVMANSLWLLGLGLLLARRFADAAPYLLPATVLAWGVLWPAVHAGLFRAAATAGRADDARRRARPDVPRLSQRAD